MTRDAVDKLFDTISPRYGDRNGGYLRIVHGGFRQGDGGDIAFVELLGSEATLDEKRQKRNELRAKRAEENRKAMEAATAEAKQAEGGEGTQKRSNSRRFAGRTSAAGIRRESGAPVSRVRFCLIG